MCSHRCSNATGNNVLKQAAMVLEQGEGTAENLGAQAAFASAVASAVMYINASSLLVNLAGSAVLLRRLENSLSSAKYDETADVVKLKNRLEGLRCGGRRHGFSCACACDGVTGNGCCYRWWWWVVVVVVVVLLLLLLLRPLLIRPLRLRLRLLLRAPLLRLRPPLLLPQRLRRLCCAGFVPGMCAARAHACLYSRVHTSSKTLLGGWGRNSRSPFWRP